ncbi:ABC transporter ATP-binding protein [Halomonas sp. PAMB 3232]|uniref:ABC transporter ATP-binding protein n=1 Tax=Halomonas sp. PAMB 3232 TaxID=3075221 RepID=UPI0028A01D56|nr:ABC transporter ATP-binding protein [Halomonas sp. PAMB 3232]WNL38264.1 ABC transporter ATP-binding protein [Halomonas sp. PAMB 3232]
MNASSLQADALTAGYGERRVLENVSVTVTPGHITAIVGANACGKSTLLRVLSRLITPASGRVLLDGHAIDGVPGRKLARQLGFLPQSPIAPEGISVLELVSRGRHPHQGLFKRWSAADEAAVADALAATHLCELAERAVDELSGGQRQRVWIAMALAQQTRVLLLDEPTTFLDINHQIDVLDLLTELNQTRGTTVVMVLHELNLAARYADTLIAMAGGRVYAAGPPESVLTEQMVREVFGLESRVIDDPVTGKPMMIPLGRHGGVKAKSRAKVSQPNELTPEYENAPQ